ncbi:MAG: TatD family hydrolase [Flavobacteriales bacterium]
MITDTHAHLYLPQFDEDRESMLQRARQAGVSKIFLPNIDQQSIEPMHRLCDANPAMCYPMMGLHPCSVTENYLEVLDDMRKLFAKHQYIAVGETGIDMYWDKSTLSIQIESFRIQLQWCIEMNLPVVIHARDSFDEIFKVLDNMDRSVLRGVFHCFGGNVQQATRIMNYETFMMGIGGVLTYEKSGLAEVLIDVPLQFLVLETDSPYLAPKPHRGKRNESAYTRIVAERLAAIKGIALEEVARITTENARRMFEV